MAYAYSYYLMLEEVLDFSFKVKSSKFYGFTHLIYFNKTTKLHHETLHKFNLNLILFAHYFGHYLQKLS